MRVLEEESRREPAPVLQLRLHVLKQKTREIGHHARPRQAFIQTSFHTDLRWSSCCTGSAAGRRVHVRLRAGWTVAPQQVVVNYVTLLRGLFVSARVRVTFVRRSLGHAPGMMS